MLDLEQYQIRGSTAREIAGSAEAAIREGLLDSGEPLPTVRALATALGTSPATVNAAYRILRQRGLIVAEGRRGTRVAPRPPLRALESARQPDYAEQPSSGLRDLAIGLPDPALLPDIGAALARVDVERKLRLTGLEAADPDLLELAAAAFEADGVSADALAVVSGAFDGLERVLQAHLRPGDRVIIEDPAYTSIRDLLLALGLVAVPVEVDEYGLVPEQFRAALSQSAQAVVIVPRAQNPFGAAMDAERASALRHELEPFPDLLVVEDDHTGPVSGVTATTVTSPNRRRWAVIRSVSKVLHPDLRLALLAGDELTVARIEGRQELGPRWVSHILQATVVELLRDPSFAATTTRARDAYTARRRALVEALAEHGLTAHGRSGLNVWVPVREEAPVIRALYEAGWIVLAGERFRVKTAPGLRITTSNLLEDEATAVAAVIAAAEGAGRPRRMY
ncbi:MAG: aminotransferase class I/II-fold pyridoxal phosphate-dependent enzyme [Solirubrobacteraceae bacterium]